MFKKVNKFKDEFSSLKKNTGFYLVVKNEKNFCFIRFSPYFKYVIV
jgi:hypothetical protein